MSNRTRNASQSDEFLLTTNNKLEYGDKGLERSLSFNDLSFLSDNNNDGGTMDNDFSRNKQYTLDENILKTSGSNFFTPSLVRELNEKGKGKEKEKKKEKEQNDVWFHPRSAFMILYNICLTIVIIVHSYTVPFIVSFTDNHLSQAETIWETFTKIIYVIDIFIWFNTGIYHHGGIIEMDKRKVRIHYIKSWLFIDTLAALPVNFVIHFFYSFPVDAESWREPHFMLLFRCVTLIKLVKIKVTCEISYLASKIPFLADSRHSLQQFIVLFIHIFWMLHVGSCLFFQIACYSRDLGYYTVLDKGNIAESSPFESYIALLYWAMETLEVGYGDITGQSTPERVYSIFFMLIGSMIYAYLLSNLIGIMKGKEKTQFNQQHEYDRVNKYLKFRNIPERLTSKVRTVYREKYSNKNWKVHFENERVILKELPYTLKNKIILEVNKQVVDSVKFLQYTDEYFISKLVKNIGEYYYAPNEIITPYRAWENQVYIISKGIVSLYTYEGRLIKEYNSNSYFGTMFLLFPQECPIIIASKTYSNIRTIDREHLDEVLDLYPKYKMSVMNELEKEANTEEAMIRRVSILKSSKSFLTIANNTRKYGSFINRKDNNSISAVADQYSSPLSPTNTNKKEEIDDLVIKICNNLGIEGFRLLTK